MKKITPHQLALLRECCQYSISEMSSDNEWYRLGGHGNVPLRFDSRTMPALLRAGLVRYDGYYKATDAGCELVAELDGRVPTP